MYNIIFPLNFPHIYLHGLYLIKPYQTPDIPTQPVSHCHCSLIPCLLLHVEPSGLVIRHILLGAGRERNRAKKKKKQEEGRGK